MDLTNFEQSADINSQLYCQCALMHRPAGISFFGTAQIPTLRYHFKEIPYLVWNAKIFALRIYVYHIIGHSVTYHKGRDSVIGIVTRYGLAGSEFDPRWWQEIFSSPHPS